MAGIERRLLGDFWRLVLAAASRCLAVQARSGVGKLIGGPREVMVRCADRSVLDRLSWSVWASDAWLHGGGVAGGGIEEQLGEPRLGPGRGRPAPTGGAPREASWMSLRARITLLRCRRPRPARPTVFEDLLDGVGA